MIATILLIVVSIAIIIIILSWGRIFTTSTFEDTSDILGSESDLTGFIYPERFTGNKVILRNLHPVEEINIIGFKINTFKQADYLNTIINLDPIVNIKSNNLGEITLPCVPDREFYLELVLENNKYLNIPLNSSHFNLQECFEFLILTVLSNKDSGVYNNDLEVTLSSNDPEAIIKYSFNEVDPEINGSVYNSNITISQSTILNFYAYNQNSETEVISKDYTLEVFGNPSSDFDTGTYYNDFSVTLSKTGETNNTKLTYTTNGTEPTINSTEYTSQIPITGTTTLKFAEFKEGYTPTNIIEKNYTLEVSALTADKPSNFYENPISVTLNSVTEDVDIYYTLNGSNPTSSDTLYTSPINIDQNTTLKAIGLKNNYNSSPILEKEYEFEDLVFEFNSLYGFGLGDFGYLGDDSILILEPTYTNFDTNFISSRNTHSLTIKDGALYSWGSNANSKTGLNTFASYENNPIQVGSFNDWSVVSAGNEHSLGIRNNGELYAWGWNWNGRTGFGSHSNSNTSTPTKVGDFNDWTFISAGGEHSLGIREGMLYAWGNNSSSQLGDGTVTQRTSPLRIGDHSDWEMVSAGVFHSLGIRDGKLYSWGSNSNGLTGLNLSTGSTNIPTQVGSFEDWTFVSAGEFHSLGIRDGKLYSWGSNSNGLTGLNLSFGSTNIPTQVGSFEDWTFVSAGSFHSLGIRDGNLYSWGGNEYGVLGNNTLIEQLEPIHINSFNDWESVSAGNSFSLAVRDGKLYSWGFDFYGNIGDGYTFEKNNKIKINDFNDWELISSSDILSGTNYSHSLGIREGKLYAWGYNEHYQLGDGSNRLKVSPKLIDSETGWTMVSAAGTTDASYSVGIKNNKLYSWGSNLNGYTGLGTLSGNTLVPTQIGVFDDWDFVSSSTIHTLAIRDGGKLYAWGRNSNGQLGLGYTSFRVTSPTLVEGYNDWSMVSAGNLFSIGIRDGKLYSWGTNLNNRTGLGTNSGNTLEITQVGSFDDWVFVSAGNLHSFAIRSNGELWAWGSNGSGRLGDGTEDTRDVPTRVGEFSDWDMASAGRSHSLGIRDGKLYSWGSNLNGRLGFGTEVDKLLIPTQIGSSNEWSYISAGAFYSLALKRD